MTLLVAAGMAGGAVVLLAGCAPDARAPLPTTPAATQSARPDDPAASTAGEDERAGSDRSATLAPRTLRRAAAEAPRGLEIRYIDDNGKFTTLAPRDFPR